MPSVVEALLGSEPLGGPQYKSSGPQWLRMLGDAAQRVSQKINPSQFVSASDAASMLPGGGLVSAVEPYQQGLQKTAAATQAFKSGQYGDAAKLYGSGFLDTANAGLQALPEGGALAKLAGLVGGHLAMAFSPRLYHATHNDFDKFALNAASTGANAGAKGEKAVFLTSRPEVADGYLGGNWVNMESPNIRAGDAAPLPNNPQVGRHYAEGANIRPVAVDNFENFDVWDMGGGGYRPEVIKQAIKEARKEKSPGVVFQNMKDPGVMTLGSGKPSDVVAVLDPRLIYSDFDKKVRASRGE